MNGKVVRGGADARYTDLFAAQVFQPLNFRFGENALGQMIFNARDEYQIVVATHHRAYEADAAVDQDLRVTAEHCRRRQRRSADIDQWKFQIIFAKNAYFLRDPRHRLRHHPRGLNTDKTIRAPNSSRTYH
ncbi:MAG TPA: hypothetical protein VGK57_01685 [Candidatus Binatia bacterium]